MPYKKQFRQRARFIRGIINKHRTAILILLMVALYFIDGILRGM